jgi:hypothetical protein
MFEKLFNYVSEIVFFVKDHLGLRVGRWNIRFFQAVLYKVNPLLNKSSNLIETAHELQSSVNRLGCLPSSASAWTGPGRVRPGFNESILSR